MTNAIIRQIEEVEQEMINAENGKYDIAIFKNAKTGEYIVASDIAAVVPSHLDFYKYKGGIDHDDYDDDYTRLDHLATVFY